MTATDKKALTLRDAAQRLQWRFTSGKEFKPNENDGIALNLLLTTINQQNEKTIQENRLFAKLYIVMLQEMAIHYKSVIRAQKQINSTLMTNSVEGLCMDLADKLNQMEGQKQIEAEPNNAAKYLEASETWDLDSVCANINLTVTQAINNYKNLP